MATKRNLCRSPVRLACALLALAAAGPFQTSYAAHVVGVADGDTITVLRGNEQIRIRLEGIDAPERGDDYSDRAKRFLSSLVFGKDVVIRPHDTDRYGRTVARVIVGETDTSVALIEQGLAWHYTQYSDDEKLAEAQRVARTAGVNIWSLPNPVPPWERRALRKRLTEPKSPAETLSESQIVYHGNVNSKIFHAPWCRYYNCKNCTRTFNSRGEAIRAGYRPGKACDP